MKRWMLKNFMSKSNLNKNPTHFFYFIPIHQIIYLMICIKNNISFQRLSVFCHTAKKLLKTARTLINFETLRNHLYLRKQNLTTCIFLWIWNIVILLIFLTASKTKICYRRKVKYTPSIHYLMGIFSYAWEVNCKIVS